MQVNGAQGALAFAKGTCTIDPMHIIVDPSKGMRSRTGRVPTGFNELDLALTRKFGQHVTGLLKYADYRADEFAVDTRKVWLQVQLDF